MPRATSRSPRELRDLAAPCAPLSLRMSIASYVSIALHVSIAACVSLTGCERRPTQAAPAWRSDCPPLARPAPLSLEAAREAHRLAERRHGLRLREAAAPGSFLRAVHAELDPQAMAAGDLCLSDLVDLGQLLFEHEYGFADGLGGGESSRAGAGPFRRVHGGLFGGPETLSCPSCHWIGGPNGAGAETDNAFLVGDGERMRSADERNPQALIALGVVEALAREMTRDLRKQRDDLVRAAAGAETDRETALVAKGVTFGTLRTTSKGEIDTSGIDGVDEDLEVKPFGWKGTLSDIADFAGEALQVHLGIQADTLLASGSEELIGKGTDLSDPDGDGIRGELGRGPFTALMTHLALLELPIVEPLIQSRAIGPAAQGLLPPTTTSFADRFARGRRHFHDLGCTSCHTPMMVLENPVITIDGLPPIDLSRDMREPRLKYDADVGGYPVWLFSDLKRHDMGPVNRARHEQNGVAPGEYLTPRLWAVADSAPYLHDGRAPSFDYAIAGHDGEGSASRSAFQALSWEQQGDLRVYLMSLRRTSRVTVP